MNLYIRNYKANNDNFSGPGHSERSEESFTRTRYYQENANLDKKMLHCVQHDRINHNFDEDKQRQVWLLPTLPGEGRTSMQLYAQKLRLSLEEYSSQNQDRFKVQMFPVGSSAGQMNYVLLRLNRYLLYQAKVSVKALELKMRGKQAIFHFADPTYSHLAWRLPRRAAITTVHDLILLKLKEGSIPIAPDQYPVASIRSFEFALAQIRRMPLVIADSRHTACELVRLAGIKPEKIRVIPLGIGPEFRPVQDRRLLTEVRDRYRLPENFLLHVGHNGFYKNIETVLEILARLRHAFPQLHLVKVGEKFTPAQREQIRRLGLEQSIIELGHIPGEDLPAIYNLARALVFPSLYEGFGWPPLEAMACGTPVIVSNVGALLEVVGTDIPTFGPDDVEAMTVAIRQALCNEDWRRYLIEAGLKQAARFAWTNTVSKTAEIYQELFELNEQC